MKKNSLYESILRDVSKSVNSQLYDNTVDDYALYENVMSDIKRIVKKHLTENEDTSENNEFSAMSIDELNEMDFNEFAEYVRMVLKFYKNASIEDEKLTRDKNNESQKKFKIDLHLISQNIKEIEKKYKLSFLPLNQNRQNRSNPEFGYLVKIKQLVKFDDVDKLLKYCWIDNNGNPYLTKFIYNPTYIRENNSYLTYSISFNKNFYIINLDTNTQIKQTFSVKPNIISINNTDYIIIHDNKNVIILNADGQIVNECTEYGTKLLFQSIKHSEDYIRDLIVTKDNYITRITDPKKSIYVKSYQWCTNGGWVFALLFEKFNGECCMMIYPILNGPKNYNQSHIRYFFETDMNKLYTIKIPKIDLNHKIGLLYQPSTDNFEFIDQQTGKTIYMPRPDFVIK